MAWHNVTFIFSGGVVVVVAVSVSVTVKVIVGVKVSVGVFDGSTVCVRLGVNDGVSVGTVWQWPVTLKLI